MQKQLETLLEDARQSYNFRLSSFNNLLTTAGIVLAADGVLLGTTTDFFAAADIHDAWKILYALFILASVVLSVRTMWIGKLAILNIEAMLANLISTPSGTYPEWLRYTIGLYAESNKKISHTYKSYESQLQIAVGGLILGIMLLIITSLIKGI